MQEHNVMVGYVVNVEKNISGMNQHCGLTRWPDLYISSKHESDLYTLRNIYLQNPWIYINLLNGRLLRFGTFSFIVGLLINTVQVIQSLIVGLWLALCLSGFRNNILLCGTAHSGNLVTLWLSRSEKHPSSLQYSSYQDWRFSIRGTDSTRSCLFRKEDWPDFRNLCKTRIFTVYDGFRWLLLANSIRLYWDNYIYTKSPHREEEFLCSVNRPRERLLNIQLVTRHYRRASGRAK